MASMWFNNGLLRILNRNIDFVTDTIKVIILKSSYTPNKAHEFVSDLTPGTHEVTSTGYAGGFSGAGRKTITGKTITLDAGNNRIVFDCADLTGGTAWSGISGADAWAYAALWKPVSSDADSPVICLLDPADLSLNGSDVNLNINPAGFARVSN